MQLLLLNGNQKFNVIKLQFTTSNNNEILYYFILYFVVFDFMYKFWFVKDDIMCE